MADDPAALPWYSQLWNSVGNGYANDPAFWLSMLPAGLGIFGQLQNAQIQNQRYGQAVKTAGQPVDWHQFYDPMAQGWQDAARREIQAELATRGIPLDSAYATALTSERMAGINNQLIQFAMQQAAQKQGGLVNTMMGAPQGSGLTGAAGAMSAIGQYIAAKRLQDARMEAMKRFGANPAVATNGLMGQSGSATDPSAMESVYQSGAGNGLSSVYNQQPSAQPNGVAGAYAPQQLPWATGYPQFQPYSFPDVLNAPGNYVQQPGTPMLPGVPMANYGVSPETNWPGIGQFAYGQSDTPVQQFFGDKGGNAYGSD